MPAFDPIVDPLPDDAPPEKRPPSPLPSRLRRTLRRALAGAVIATPTVAILALTLAPRTSVAVAREATVTTPHADQGFVSVTAEAERALVFDPAQPVHVVVTVKGGPAPASTPRPPARIALVVDRSGSMGGHGADDKMGFARQAVGAFLRGLGPRDTCTVLGFDDQVETVIPWVPGGELAASDARIQALTPRGGTNIAAALDVAERAVLAAAQPGEARRIVLLTDGIDGSGRDLRALAQRLRGQDITLSCHGFGTDLNAPLLSSMAETGGGNFLFVDSGPRAVTAFETERDLALATVASGVTLRLEPAPGVEIDEVVSWEAARDGAARVVRIGDLAATAEKKVVVRVRWARGCVRDGRVPLARVTCVASRPGETAATASTLDVHAGLAGTAEAALASARPHLEAKLAQARFAITMTDVQRRLESGDLQGARAVARTAYEHLAANPGALAEVRARTFVASDAVSVFFETGDLPAEAEKARCVVPAGCLPVGK